MREIIRSRKFTFLLLSIIFLALAGPVMVRFAGIPLVPLFLLIIIIAALKAAEIRHTTFVTCSSVAFLGFVLHFITHTAMLPVGKSLLVLSFLAYVAVIAYVIFSLLGTIFAKRIVTRDSIRVVFRFIY